MLSFAIAPAADVRRTGKTRRGAGAIKMVAGQDLPLPLIAILSIAAAASEPASSQVQKSRQCHKKKRPALFEGRPFSVLVAGARFVR